MSLVYDLKILDFLGQRMIPLFIYKPVICYPHVDIV